jgi:hypothetical protein
VRARSTISLASGDASTNTDSLSARDIVMSMILPRATRPGTIRDAPILRTEHAMTFEIFKAYPPERHAAVVELHVASAGSVEIPVQVFRHEGELQVSIFTRDGSVAWEFPLEELMTGLQRAAEAIG